MVDQATIDNTGPAARERAHLGRGGGLRIEIIQTVVLALVTFFAIQNLVAQPFQVKGISMEGTFGDSDYVLVDRLTPRWDPYARGQIVVFNPPESAGNRSEPYIKRVIGVAGDTVEIRSGHALVNGVELDEPYLFRDSGGQVEPTLAAGQSYWVVPEGQLFVMGDHREASNDSRVFGPITTASVIGRGIARYWPLSEVGAIVTPTYGKVAPRQTRRRGCRRRHRRAGARLVSDS